MTIRLSLKVCGEGAPVGQIVLNPEWPRGTDPHLRRCKGCAECEPDDPAKWLEPLKLYVTHVYDAADHLHDYYVHLTVSGAVRQAATDVVSERFPDLSQADFKAFEAEVKRVIAATSLEPGVGRRAVLCDAWRAHVDEMRVLP